MRYQTKKFTAKFEYEFFNSWATENKRFSKFDEKWYPSYDEPHPSYLGWGPSYDGQIHIEYLGIRLKLVIQNNLKLHA